MTLTAKTYIALVIGAGTAVLAYSLHAWSPQDLPRFCCYLILAMPASCMKVRLPGITGTMSVLFLFLLAGIVELGLSETVLIGAVCVVVQSFWHAKSRPRAVQLVFSVADIAAAIWAAYAVYTSLSLLVPVLQAPFRLVIAGSMFFLVNTLLVAVVIALTEAKPLRAVWTGCYSWCFPYYLVGAAIIGMFTFANRKLDLHAWLLILPVIYVIYRSYLVYTKQLETERRYAEVQRKHAEEERSNAEQVASLHVRAMKALTSAMAAHAKLDAVIQASPLAILALDRDGNVTTWNTTAKRILGWQTEEPVGGPPTYAGGKSGDIIRGIIDSTLKGGLVSGVELTHHRADGTPFDAAVWTAPLREHDESISGALVTLADISERKHLEEQLRLSEKMAVAGRLASGVAHDFNNLLTIINGYGTMLQESLKGDAEANQAMEVVNACNRAAELLSRLLTLSPLQIVRPKPLEINQVVRDVEGMLQQIIGEHIELRIELAPDAGWIEADLNQIEALLLDLVSNARDAMPQGGVLSIETSRVDIAALRQQEQPPLPAGSYVRLIVRDTGHGMDSEALQHLFDPRFTTKEESKGTGLGLSSVYSGVEQSHGRTFVVSELGKGTIFSIYLPRFDRTASYEPAPVPSGGSCEGNETILLVEDESAVRGMLREVLSRAGYRVWEAANWTDALQVLGARIDQVDLVVTDIVMPLMSVRRLAEELRKHRPTLKIIFMSGHSEELIKAQQGPDRVPEILQKPLLPEVLVRKVRQSLSEAPRQVPSVHVSRLREGWDQRQQTPSPVAVGE